MQDNVLPEDPVSAEERANKLAAKESAEVARGRAAVKINVCWDAAVCAVSAGGFFSVGMAFRMRTSADRPDPRMAQARTSGRVSHD